MDVFIKKYVPEKQMASYAKKSGLCKKTLYDWYRLKSKPNTFELICFCEVISIRNQLDFEMLILEAINFVVRQ